MPLQKSVAEMRAATEETGAKLYIMYQNSTNLIQQGTIKCGEKKNGSDAEMNCRNQGIEKSTDAEIGAESRADSRAESCSIIDAEPYADVRAVFRAVVRADLRVEKIAPMRKHLQIRSG